MKKGRYPKKEILYKSFESDFVKAVPGAKKVGKDYKYIHTNPIWRAIAFVIYRLIATPAAFIYTKLFLRERFVGKEKLKGYKGYILYAAHNEPVGDAFSPSILNFPRKTYIVIHPDNVALPVIGKVLPMLGGLPTPSDIRAARNFSEAVSAILERGATLVIYPEAHVWPKFTGVRPFSAASFDIAAVNNVPVFSAKRVYKKHFLFGYSARTYIDGPFYSDMGLPRRERGEQLSSAVREAMMSHVNENEVEIIKYIKDEK